MCWFNPLESGTQSRSPTRMAGTQLLEPSALASQGVHNTKLELGEEPGTLIQDVGSPIGVLTAMPNVHSPKCLSYFVSISHASNQNVVYTRHLKHTKH